MSADQTRGVLRESLALWSVIYAELGKSVLFCLPIFVPIALVGLLLWWLL